VIHGIAKKMLQAGALVAGGAWFASAMLPAAGTPDTNSPKTAVLHATITVTGGISFTGSFDDRLEARTCADAAKNGTGWVGNGAAMFMVPSPPEAAGGNPGPVGGGHNFMTDAAALPYHGPGTYTGAGLNATQMDVDTPPGSQESHIFAFPTGIGTLVVRPDASGSFQFNQLQDPNDVRVSGQVVWTCS
jgi:hypothetical protein